MNIKLNLSTILIVGAIYYFFIRKTPQTFRPSVEATRVDDMSPMNNSYGV